MKIGWKFITLSMLVVGLVVAATAFARGPMMGNGGGGHGMAYAVSQLPPEKQAAAQKLWSEHVSRVAPLREQLYAKNTELNALLANPKADQGKVKALTNDINDLRGKMLTENTGFRLAFSKETGITAPGGGMGMGGKHGMGGGYGSGGCGY